MNNKGLKAFSIVEAIVSMAIMAIILSVVFFIFSITTERMLDYKEQNQLVNDLNRLNYSLNKDIFENEKMSVYEDQIIFNGYSGKLIQYNFNETYMLRSTEAFVDTFKIILKNKYIDSVKSSSHKKVFLKLHLNVVANEKEIDLNFYKHVYANELLQQIKK